MSTEEKNPLNDELDLGYFFKSLWLKKFLILKFSLIFGLIGLIIGITSPNEYLSTTILLPESADQNSGFGALGGLAALAGADLGALTNSGGLHPGLYRSISKSAPFLRKLIHDKFYFSEIDSTISLYDYYWNYQKGSLVGYILYAPNIIIEKIKGENKDAAIQSSSSSILSISMKEQKVIEDLESRITVTMDWDLSVLSIEVYMQDPVVAAEVANLTMIYITNFVTDYALSRVRNQISYVEEQSKLKYKEFETAQEQLANFRDHNQFINTASIKSQEEKLIAIYNLKYGVYNQLLQQKESLNLKLLEISPVFSTIEPVMIPNEKESPRRFLILLGFTFLGASTGIFLSIVKK